MDRLRDNTDKSENRVTNSEQVLRRLLVMPACAFLHLIMFLHFVLITIPVSSATAERSFNSMKRVATYLR